MMGVSKDSSVSVDMITWPNISPLHSICEQPHLSLFCNLLLVVEAKVNFTLGKLTGEKRKEKREKKKEAKRHYNNSLFMPQ